MNCNGLFIQSFIILCEEYIVDRLVLNIFIIYVYDYNYENIRIYGYNYYYTPVIV